MSSIELTAYAKVNLVLKILDKRKDSYHNLFTVFERVSLGDRIRIARSARGISLSSNKYITKEPESNLAYKAASLILGYKGVKSGVKIHIVKKTPIAGGLGGGSSDAAAVLVGINKLYNLRLTVKELMKLGSKLGADVPFFILDESVAIGEGIGDRLKPVSAGLKLWHLLINPGFHVPTKDIYADLDRLRQKSPKALTQKPYGAKIISLFRNKADFGTIEAMLYNDLEKVVVAKKAVLGSIIKRLDALLGKKAIVSGSGPSVFCLYSTRKEALRAKSIFLGSLSARQREKWQAFVVGTC